MNLRDLSGFTVAPIERLRENGINAFLGWSFVKVRRLKTPHGFFMSKRTAYGGFPFNIPISIRSRRLRDMTIGVFRGHET